MHGSVEGLMALARPRAGGFEREQIAAEVCAALFGSEAPLTVGRYAVESRIGAGGMGIVYRGYDPQLDRRVAIKLLDLRRVVSETARAQARLLREARSLAQLTHPNVVSVYDVGLVPDSSAGAEPRLYLVMEYVEGPTLREWMRAPRSVEARLALLLEVGRGLVAAHAAGLIHGDFKPENILVGSDGRARVADFGLALPILAHERVDSDLDLLATLESGGADHCSASTSIRDDPQLTISGVFGTPAYIAPEQFVGGRIDARADQFAFCVVACEVLYGRRPFRGDSLEDLARAALSGDLDSLDAPAIPRAVRGLLVRGLSADPGERFADLAELLSRLEAAFRRKRARHVAIVAASIAGFVGLAGWLAWPEVPAAGSDCVAAETRLEPIWHPSKARTIEARLEAVGLGPASVTLVHNRLDDQARQWAAAWTDTCTATSDATSRARTRACLDARLLELSTVADKLSVVDAEGEPPLVLLEDLTPIAGCLDRTSLDAERPVPLERERRESVEAVRNTLLIPARFAERDAVELASEGLAEARALGFRPLEAEAELTLAGALQRAERIDEAIAMAERAHLSAEAARHPLVLADAAGLRVRLAYESGAIDDGRAWLVKAEAANEAAGGDAIRAARLHGSACMLELMDGSFAAAIEQCEHAHELIEGGAAVDQHTRLQLEINFALAEYGAGLIDRANRRLAATHDEIVAELGPTDRRLAHIMLTWGHLAYQRWDFDAALDRYRRGLEIERAQAHRDRPTSVGVSLEVSVADVLQALGEVDAAERAYTQILARAPDSWTRHVARSGLALVALNRGDPRAAFDLWSQQLADERDGLDPSHPWMLDLAVNIGEARVLFGEVDEGLAQIDAVVTTLEAQYGPDNPELTSYLWVRGHVEHEIGDFDRCVADLDRVRRLELGRSGPGTVVLAAIDSERAACQLARGDEPAPLVDELGQIVATLEAGPLREREALARIELGRAHRSMGDGAAAREQLERARELLGELQGDHRDALEDIAALLD